MPSLTPVERAEEISWEAMKEGFVNGGLTLIPAYGCLLLALRNPKFRMYTNWQSRTALVIMPGLFTFGYSAEHSLSHRMRKMAQDTEHNREVARWAEQKHAEEQSNGTAAIAGALGAEQRLTELYRQSVEQSGVRIIKGQLGIHHKIANYWQENPFKVLVGLGVPTVAYIFYGRTGQQHLQTSMKIMHTRVMGQFSVITLLLGLMGFKEYMDHNGKFITEAEANARVEEMHAVRQELKARLAHERNVHEKIERERAEAYARDEAAGNIHKKKNNKKHKKAAAKKEVDTVVVVVEEEEEKNATA